MKSEYKDFIGMYHSVYEEGFCEHIISEFERLNENGNSYTRQESEENVARHYKDDIQIFANTKEVSLRKFNNASSEQIFFAGLQKCYSEYTNKYSVLKDNILKCNSMKIQRTGCGGGYHLWHAEQGSGEGGANRGAAYMLYLNDIPLDSFGETEFLYQQRRISPSKNTLLIWPAGHTHAHRGNPVYGDVYKYVITGWFCYKEVNKWL
jgi:hypothetical protein